MHKTILATILVLSLATQLASAFELSTHFKSIHMDFPKTPTSFKSIDLTTPETLDFTKPIQLPYKSDPTINKNITYEHLNKNYDHEAFNALIQEEISKAEKIRDKLINTQTRDY